MLTAGISPIPFKVVSVMSGFTQMPISVFLASALLGRATRFFVVATLLKRYGETIRSFIETYLGWLFLFFIILFLIDIGSTKNEPLVLNEILLNPPYLQM